jgi:hypothetical protein
MTPAVLSRTFTITMALSVFSCEHESARRTTPERARLLGFTGTAGVIALRADLWG